MKSGRVYRIIHLQSNICYVGSTFNQVRHRFQQHKRDYRSWKKNKSRGCYSIYKYFDEYGVGNFKAVLINEYTVCDRKHLRAYEQLWVNNLKSINKNSAFRIKKLYQKQYQKKNKEKINLRLRTKSKCECGSYISNRNMSKHRKTSKKHKILMGFFI